MRPTLLPYRRVSFALALWLCAGAGAQQPTDPPAPQRPEAAAQPPAAEAKPEAPAESKPEPVVAIRAAVIHPVAGPDIQDGVVLIRGERIVAVGSRAEVVIPAEATTYDHPGAHVYPGLVDALTDAFTDVGVRNDGALDAATAVVDGLRARGDREDELVQSGITTAYVTSRSGAQWRGQGAIVRPQAGGFAVLAGKERAAVQLRLTNGPVPSHALQRQQQAQAVFAAFDGLADYKKAFADHKTALEKYGKDFADYLAFHEKKKAPTGTPANAAAGGNRDGARGDGGNRGAGGDPAQGGAGSGPGPRGTRGGRRGGGGGGPPGDPPAEQRPAAANPAPAPATQEPGKPAEAAADKPPERPKFPKEPARDPAKDALLDVLDGKLPLRIEAHRADEIRAALALAADKKVPVVVLEQVYGGAAVAAELAKAAATCVLTEVWPRPLPKPYDAFDTGALPAALQRSGVPFAIATGSGRRAAVLPLMAATAVGLGLDAAAALRAITLTPAEILGVQHDTGSLQPGKLADVLVCDQPLFASDCRVLRVLSGGKNQYEAK